MKPTHYVDNKKLLVHLTQHRELVQAAIKAGTTKPRISNYIGECILLIAKKLSNRPNFINYPFKEEMIGDGIENCLMYIDNFDPTKSNNPFAYITQIIYFAFIRRITKEKKHLYTKHKLMESVMTFNDEQEEWNKVIEQQYVENEHMNDFAASFEQSLKKKVKKPIEEKIHEDISTLEHELLDNENSPDY
jgi:hypothetical protein